MSQTFDVILKSGTVVNQDGEGVCDIGITGGRIAALGALGQASAGETIDCKGLHILPGVRPATSLVTRPCRKYRASGPEMARTARSLRKTGSMPHT
jgi:dihydroorotase-like cyclic amidohydrolase